MPLPLSYNVRNLRVRWRTSLPAIAAIAIVVGMFVFMTSIGSGFRRALAATGSPENAILLRKGADSELVSGIGREAAHAFVADDRIARDAKGEPLASAEIVVVVTLPRKGDGTPNNVLLRGVSPAAFEVRTGIRVLRGRIPAAGLYEIMVGRRLQDRMMGLDLGATVAMQRKPWRVVGVFESDGSGFESEIWGDREVFADAFNRRATYQSITVRLRDPADLPSFAAAIALDPRFQCELKQERAFYEEQSGTIGRALIGLNAFVSVVMAIGAVFAAMNTMYATVASRSKEVGTLRALGFSRGSILLAFVIESVALAAAGGALGCLASLPLDGLTANIGPGFSQLIFDFRITPRGLAAGVVFSLAMGLLGGLLPALRASRLPVVEALRSS